MLCKVMAMIITCVLLSSAGCDDDENVEWHGYAANNASSKYLPVDKINADNVHGLVQKWVWDSPDNAIVGRANINYLQLWPNAYESTPLMVGGRLFVSTSLSQVVAINADNGKTLWTYDPKSYLSADGSKFVHPPNVGLVQRGVAYWLSGDDERVFFATGNATLVALDARTGQPISDFGSGGVIDLKQGLRRPAPQSLYGMSSPPLVCGNVVVVGSSILDFPLQKPLPPGDVRGFDAVSGHLLWTFHTVPEDGEAGADTWSASARAETGSTNVWAPMSCDDETGIVYMPVSESDNNYYGGSRPGQNWFTNSLVALQSESGKLVWSYQMVHHALWDYDPPAAPILVDIRQHGQLTKAVAQVSKQGFVFVFNRATGEPIWPIEEQPVPESRVPGEQASKTQPIPTKPLPFDLQGLSDDDLIDFTPSLRAEAQATVAQYVYGPLYTPPTLDNSAIKGTRGTIMMPGNVGGSSWTGAAFNPKTGILYVPSVTKPAIARLFPFSSATYAGEPSLLSMPDGLPISKPPYGRLTAIDLNTGDQLWMQPVGNGPIHHPALLGLGLKDLGWDRRSFFLVTDSLLFGAQEGIVTANPIQLSQLTKLNLIKNDDAFLWALDPRTGKKLLELPMQYGNASGSLMTYVLHGRQFIVVPVGGAGNPARLVAYGLP